MSSVYDQHLPAAFPFLYMVKSEQVDDLLQDLRAAKTSFAVTMDTNGRDVKLWLSEASQAVLLKNGKLK